MSPALPAYRTVGGPPPSEARAGHTQAIEVRLSLAPRFPSAIPSPATAVYLLAALTVLNESDFMASLSSLFHRLTAPCGLTFSLICSFDIPHRSLQLVNSHSALVD